MKDSTKITGQSYPVELFTDIHFAEPYQCTICHLVPSPDSASNHAKCGAIFCKSCLDSWLSKHKDCPKCRGKIYANLTKQDNHIVYQLHQKLMLKCPEDAHCTWKGVLSDLTKHRRECKYIANSCRYSVAGCDFRGTADDLLEHEQSYKDKHLAMCLAVINELKEEVVKSKLNEEVKVDPIVFRKDTKILVDLSKKKQIAAYPEEEKERMTSVQKEKHELLKQRNKLREFQRHVQEESGHNLLAYRRVKDEVLDDELF